MPPAPAVPSTSSSASASKSQWSMSVPFVVGLVIGAVAAFIFSPYLLQSALGRAVFPDYHVIRFTNTPANPNEAGTPEKAATVPSPTEAGLSAKASAISAEYRSAGDASLKAFNDMQSANNTLNAALTALTAEIVKGNSQNIPAKVAAASPLVAPVAQLNAQFSASLRAFSKAEAGANAGVKAATDAYVAAGNAASAAISAYLDALAPVLSGAAVPSQSQVDAVAAKGGTYAQTVGDFNTALVSLNAALEGKAATSSSVLP